jgi:hypothetical protein
MEQGRATLDPIVARNPNLKVSAKVASNHSKILRNDSPHRRQGRTRARFTAMRSPACSCTSVTAASAWLMVILTIAGAVVMFVAEHAAMGLPIVASSANYSDWCDRHLGNILCLLTRYPSPVC